MLPRISELDVMSDIYTMKDSVYIEEKEKDYEVSASNKKPIVVILIVATVLILLLNLISTIFFY